MNIVHKTQRGHHDWATTHPNHDIEFDRAFSRAEFHTTYGRLPKDIGQPIQVEGFDRIFEYGGKLCLLSINDSDDVEVWTGTAVQDQEGYYYEAE